MIKGDDDANARFRSEASHFALSFSTLKRCDNTHLVKAAKIALKRDDKTPKDLDKREQELLEKIFEYAHKNNTKKVTQHFKKQIVEEFTVSGCWENCLRAIDFYRFDEGKNMYVPRFRHDGVPGKNDPGAKLYKQCYGVESQSVKGRGRGALRGRGARRGRGAPRGRGALRGRARRGSVKITDDDEKRIPDDDEESIPDDDEESIPDDDEESIPDDPKSVLLDSKPHHSLKNDRMLGHLTDGKGKWAKLSGGDEVSPNKRRGRLVQESSDGSEDEATLRKKAKSLGGYGL